MAVAVSPALAVVSSLRADDLGHLGLHQLVDDPEPNPDREREQALSRGAGRIVELRATLIEADGPRRGSQPPRSGPWPQ